VCNLPSSRGLCMPVPPGQDPRDACAEQPGPTCGLDGTCDGTGVCRRPKLGTECGPPGCASEVDRILPSTCDGAGTCQIGEPRSCAPFTCLAGACRTTCASNAECAPGRSCNNGSCGPKPLGASCTTRDECNSGNCVQGVCCDVAECPAEATTSCGRTGRCDGGRCQKHAQNTVCGVRTCMGSTELAPPVCDGRGMCVPTGTKSCSPYVCKGDGCATSCTGDTECLSSYYCVLNACRARRAIGSTCSEARECATNACVDGTCCTSVCRPNEYCAAGRVCANKRAIGTPCDFGYECVGNQCVDGLCCETTCTEVCRRCNDSAVTAGRCVPVPAGQTDTGCTGTRACDGTGNCRTR
jgi:hypothetical protein